LATERWPYSAYDTAPVAVAFGLVRRRTDRSDEAMHEAISIIPLLAVMLVGAKLAGLASQRFGMPAVFGELLLGLILGPSLFNFIEPNEIVHLLGQIGVIALMFMAGLETELGQMLRVGRASLLTALGGVLLPLGGGYLIGVAFGLEQLHALFVGAVLTATSVSISAEVLRELGWLRGKLGATILGAAVIDDVLGVIVLSVVLALAGEGSLWLTLAKMVIFLPAAWLVGDWLIPRLMKAERYVPQKETAVAVLIGVLLIYAWSAEALGSIAAITGAYLLGIIVSRHTDPGHHLHDSMNVIGYGFFVPIFFVSIGLEARAGALLGAPALAAAVLAMALAGKVVGCGVGARLGGFSQIQSLAIGVGMIARGEVALVMIAAGQAAGLVDDQLFSATIVMTLVTTLVTPPLLRMALTASERVQNGEGQSAVAAE
jgi:Kef-type K+ transport system membrane component KefB